MIVRKLADKKIIQLLHNDGVGILPTDTLYGLVGLALSKKAVRRIYQLRQRNPKKPMIILISSLADLKLFNIKIDNKIKKYLSKLWPNKVSVILPMSDKCSARRFFYLHRGTNTLAFRLPAKKSLVNLIKKVGPLVAPSANLEGKPVAKTIKEAKKYFSDKADFYVNAGKISGPPSTLIQIKNNKILIKRKGAVKICEVKL